MHACLGQGYHFGLGSSKTFSSLYRCTHTGLQMESSSQDCGSGVSVESQERSVGPGCIGGGLAGTVVAGSDGLFPDAMLSPLAVLVKLDGACYYCLPEEKLGAQRR